MMRSLLTALALAAAVATVPAVSHADRPDHRNHDHRHVTIPTRPCASDDGHPAPCVWDAGARGNGTGHSFWTDRRGRVHYLALSGARH
jgi:hypothetical protein